MGEEKARRHWEWGLWAQTSGPIPLLPAFPSLRGKLCQGTEKPHGAPHAPRPPPPHKCRINSDIQGLKGRARVAATHLPASPLSQRMAPSWEHPFQPPQPSRQGAAVGGGGGEGVAGGLWPGPDLAAGAQAVLAAHRSRGPLAAAVDAAFFSSSSSSSSTNIYSAPTVCRALCREEQ